MADGLTSNNLAKVSLSQLLRQAQEGIRAEVLRLLKETLEVLLEGLRDEVVGR